MHDIESGVRRRTRNTKIQKAVLSSVKIAGLLAWSMIAPNTLQLLGSRNKVHGKSAKNATRRLIQKGLLKQTPLGLTLTPAGERFLESLPPERQRWDGKWRIVIFDIPELRKKSRDSLRQRLMQIGFRKLQSSVWIYPYDCEELLTLLKHDYKLGKDVMYIVADAIERDGSLKRHFSLA